MIIGLRPGMIEIPLILYQAYREILKTIIKLTDQTIIFFRFWHINFKTRFQLIFEESIPENTV